MNIDNIIAIANFIKLRLPGFDDGDIQLTESQDVNTTATTSASAIPVNNHMCSTSSTTSTSTIMAVIRTTTMANCINVKLLRNIEQ